jgi:hypothetical protein
VLKEVTDQAASLLRNLEMEQEDKVEPLLSSYFHKMLTRSSC